YQDAVKFARVAFGMNSSTKQRQASAKCAAGLALARAGSSGEGKSLCLEGVAIAASLGESSTVSDSHRLFAEILLVAGNLQAAREESRVAVEILERTGRKE